MKWIAGSGAGLTWTSLDSSSLNSLASTNAILSGTQIDNSTSLDMFADISLILASATFVAPAYVGIYLYPLSDDNATYGDGRFGSAAAGPPPSNYAVGTIGLVAGTQAQTGQLLRIIIPPAKFKFVYYNLGGVAWNASGNTVKYRTYNQQVA
jgi:hypothetical protein